MVDPSEVGGRGKSVVASSEAGGSERGAGPVPPRPVAAPGSEDHVSEMMGRLRLMAAESAAVVLDDRGDDFPTHSEWAIVGKVLSPTKLHISTISAAHRPVWGNPRGLLFNPAGDNTFVAEFGSRADKERVVDGPPWVVGKHAVLLKDFDIDQRPQDMVFNRLKIWARIINLPFGYMNKKWGSAIARPLGVEGSVPVVAYDGTGRCWGSFMRVKVEVDTDKPLMRGVTIFSQRRNMTEWFDVQYEQLPRYCFACGILGHSSLECKNPGDRDVDGKLPYSSDRLCPPDEKNKKPQGARSAADSSSQGHSSQQFNSERPSQTGGTGSSTRQKQQGGEDAAVSSPVKQNKHRGRANKAKDGQNVGKEFALAKKDAITLTGQKRKTQKVCELKDLGFEGPKFTWSNRQEADTHVKVRLDRAVANGMFSVNNRFNTVLNMKQCGSVLRTIKKF
ncbi:hypothetical protein ACQ4PT_043964 [Festuca glaucescens]